MVVDLNWWRVSARCFQAEDGKLTYRVRMDAGGRWRIQMNNAAIGEKGGFGSDMAAKDYVDWGGVPNRMGWDRDTGEAHDERFLTGGTDRGG